MMYKSNFVCSLKVGGKILRENSGTVSLPFGSEYGILLKNLNSRRAMVKVWVDGQDATEGTKLILPANGSLDLERFIKNGNLSSGNRFKFIERTRQIENHRGIKEDDGLIRAEFWAEKEVVDLPTVRRQYYDKWYPIMKYYDPWYTPVYPTYPWGPTITYTSGGLVGSANCSTSLGGNNTQSNANVGMFRCVNMQMSQSSLGDESFNDAGITVPGSESSQKFQSSYGFDLESNSHVVVLQLKGEIGGAQIEVPLTVDLKPTCPTCGKKNKPHDKFCGECGTSLHLI